MATSVLREDDFELRGVLRLSVLFGMLVVALHLALNLYQAHIGWGYFRDEFYYIACGRHLAWGYVDHGPLVAVQARLSETVFGRSLAGLRFLSGFAGGVRVFLTGVLAWSLGGRRAAQVLAMLAVSVAPIYLVLDGFLSMNSFESLFWMTSLLAIILMERGGSAKWWLLFGFSSGLGLLNKPSMAFFLAALLVALAATPQRRLLRSGWAVPGISIMLLLALPNILWQKHHHWVTLEFLHSNQMLHASDRPDAFGLVKSQWLGLNPVGILVWVPGLLWLLRRPERRWLGITYLVFFGMMIANHAKDYYPTPIYPLLFAAGGVAWESRLQAAKRLQVIGFPILECVLLLTGVLLLPTTNPILSPEQWVAYNRALHLRGGVSDPDAMLPQYLADRFGWEEEVRTVTRAVGLLTPEDRAKVRILCSDYGEAGALEFLGHDLPPVISGHNNYFVWGPQEGTGEVMIVVNGASMSEMQKVYEQVERVGGMESAYAMNYENRRSVYVARGRRTNLTATWAEQKHYD